MVRYFHFPISQNTILNTKIMCKDFVESLPNEVWRDVVGYEGHYKVSSLGRVYSVPREHISKSGHRHVCEGGIMMPAVIRKGYLRVGLSLRDKQKGHLVHRLVAEAFIPNPNNYPQINHKNSVKDDNRVENLEWCTNSYNYHYGDRIKTFTKSYGVPVVQYTKDGQFVREYEYASLAARDTGIDVHNILACARRYNPKRPVKSAGGFVWRVKGEPF